MFVGVTVALSTAELFWEECTFHFLIAKMVFGVLGAVYFIIRFLMKKISGKPLYGALLISGYMVFEALFQMHKLQ